RCLQMCESLAGRSPKDITFRVDLADVYGHYGDAQLRQGQTEAAAQNYQKSRENLLIVLNHDPGDTSQQPLVALAQARLAAIALGQGKRDEAAKRYEGAAKIWDDLVRLDPNNRTWQAAHAVALARAGKMAEAEKKADELAKNCANSPELLLQVARCQAIRAAN